MAQRCGEIREVNPNPQVELTLECMRTRENTVSWSVQSHLEFGCLSQSKFLVRSAIKSVPGFLSLFQCH